MTRARSARLLGGFLGVSYLVLGLVETTIALSASDPIGFFWFPALCGGGALVLAGVFMATPWTIVGPILSLALIFLCITGSPARTPSAA